MGEVEDHAPCLHPGEHLAAERPSARAAPRRARIPRTPCRRSGPARSSGCPMSATTSTFAGSSSSAWAPSIASRPAVIEPRAWRAARYAARSACERTTRNAPVRRVLERKRPGRQVLDAGQQAGPRRAGPALGERDREDVVARVPVALDVEAARRLDRHREDLQRDVALDEARARRPRRGSLAEGGRGPTAASRRGGPRRAASRAALRRAPTPARRSAGPTGFIRSSTRPTSRSSTGPAAAAPASAAPAAIATLVRRLMRRRRDRGSAGS